MRDRNRITGADVTSDLDVGLTIVAELRDRTYAECAQLTSEYNPHPPFNAGRRCQTNGRVDALRRLAA